MTVAVMIKFSMFNISVIISVDPAKRCFDRMEEREQACVAEYSRFTDLHYFD